MKRFLAVTVILAFYATPAFAQEVPALATSSPTLCSAPTAPPLYLPAALPAEPTPPKCVNIEKNTTTCSNKVFNDWQTKVSAHNDLKRKRVTEMNAYGRELQRYQNAATNYAQCEQERVAELLPE